MESLAPVPDPRRRQGRLYPLASVLGLLILASVDGESSLRGMWLWGREHWLQFAPALGFETGSRAPQCWMLGSCKNRWRKQSWKRRAYLGVLEFRNEPLLGRRYLFPALRPYADRLMVLA